MAATSLTKDPAALHAYRQRWINEGDAHGRVGRYTTEMVRALGTSVPEAYVPRGDRFLPGTSKAVEATREKAQEQHGCDGVWMLCRALPDRFTLAQLRKGLESLKIELSVDQSKDLWRFLDPLEAGTCTRATALEALLGRPMSQRRIDAVSTVWALLSRIHAGTSGSSTAMADAAAAGSSTVTPLASVSGEPSVPVLTILTHYDPSPANHPDVRSRVVPSAEAAKRRLRECAAWVLAGEPPAPPIVVYQRQSAAGAAAAAAANDTGGLSSPTSSQRSSYDTSAAAMRSASTSTSPLSMRSGSVTSGRTGSTAGSGSTVGLSPSMMLPRSAFFRVYELISAGVDSEAGFVDMLVACWHLGEAEYTLAPPPPSAVTAYAIATGRLSAAPEAPVSARSGRGSVLGSGPGTGTGSARTTSRGSAASVGFGGGLADTRPSTPHYGGASGAASPSAAPTAGGAGVTVTLAPTGGAGIMEDGFTVPASMQPVLEAAVRERKGFPVPPTLHMAAAAASRVTGPVPPASFETSLRSPLAGKKIASHTGLMGATGTGMGAAGEGSGAGATFGSPGPAYGRGLPTTHMTLLVTHTDGRRSLQKIPADRFLRRDDPADLRARLASRGITDVASVSADF